jgi:hypothetical protein
MKAINEEADLIKIAFVSNEDMRSLYDLETKWQEANIQSDEDKLTFYNQNFSKISVETIFIYIIASVAVIVKSIIKRDKEEITQIVERERYGHVSWYKKMALKFQFGEDVSNDYSEDSSFAETDTYAVIDESKQIIKYAHAEDGLSSVLLKIAKGGNEQLSPLSEKEFGAFRAYINRVKPGGVVVDVINSLPDKLYLKLIVYYNPLILNIDGKLLGTDIEPARIAVTDFLKSIEFNGEFVGMKLVDVVQKVEGIEIVEIAEAKQQHGSYPIEDIDVRYTPYSGYMELAFLDIDYIPNGRV